jgi:glyoxylase-like metal-dependent hydrolase (beta-lactamase superfamily II)
MTSSNWGALTDQASVRTLTVGDVRLTYVVDGAMAFAPATFFPAVPTDVWTGSPWLDASGMVPMSAGGLLVERAGQRLLIDAGLGPVRDSRAQGAANSGALLETLTKIGHEPAAIDVLALTHLHADHVGWVARPDDGGAFRQIFGAARHVVSAAEWAAYPPGGGTLPPPVAAASLDAIAAGLTLADDGDEIFPGVHAIVTPGHSPGHTSYLIRAGAERILAFGDAFHHPIQLAHPEWGSGPDANGATVPEARRRLIAEMLRPGTYAFATHFGDQVFGQVAAGADGTLGWDPVTSTVISGPPRRLDEIQHPGGPAVSAVKGS